jgi:hypothetical protein
MKPDRSRSILLLFWLMLSGCRNQTPPPAEYFVLIERIEDVPGEHYSPAIGRQPLFCIHVRLVGADGKPRRSSLRLYVPGLYRPEMFGREGDWVSFRIAGQIPLGGEIWIEQLAAYRVLPREASDN